jgi:hypothetical protein
VPALVQFENECVRETKYLRMTLQWSTGLFVDIDDGTIRITWQVHTHININPDFGHFIIDFSLAKSEISHCL